MLLEIDEDILDLMIEEIKQMHRWMILEEVYYKEQQVMDENIVEHLKEKKYEDYFKEYYLYQSWNRYRSGRTG